MIPTEEHGSTQKKSCPSPTSSTTNPTPA